MKKKKIQQKKFYGNLTRHQHFTKIISRNALGAVMFLVNVITVMAKEATSPFSATHLRHITAQVATIGVLHLSVITSNTTAQVVTKGVTHLRIITSNITAYTPVVTIGVTTGVTKGVTHLRIITSNATAVATKFAILATAVHVMMLRATKATSLQVASAIRITVV